MKSKHKFSNVVVKFLQQLFCHIYGDGAFVVDKNGNIIEDYDDDGSDT